MQKRWQITSSIPIPSPFLKNQTNYIAKRFSIPSFLYGSEGPIEKIPKTFEIIKTYIWENGKVKLFFLKSNVCLLVDNFEKKSSNFELQEMKFNFFTLSTSQVALGNVF